MNNIKGFNEAWTKNEKDMIDTLVGKTVEDAKKLFPEYRFQSFEKRGNNEVFYVNLVNVVTDSNGIIQGLIFG